MKLRYLVGQQVKLQHKFKLNLSYASRMKYENSWVTINKVTKKGYKLKEDKGVRYWTDEHINIYQTNRVHLVNKYQNRSVISLSERNKITKALTIKKTGTALAYGSVFSLNTAAVITSLFALDLPLIFDSLYGMTYLSTLGLIGLKLKYGANKGILDLELPEHIELTFEDKKNLVDIIVTELNSKPLISKVIDIQDIFTKNNDHDYRNITRINVLKELFYEGVFNLVDIKVTPFYSLSTGEHLDNIINVTLKPYSNLSDIELLCDRVLDGLEVIQKELNTLSESEQQQQREKFESVYGNYISVIDKVIHDIKDGV